MGFREDKEANYSIDLSQKLKYNYPQSIFMQKRFLSLLIIPLFFLTACAEEVKETPEIPAPNVKVLDLAEKPQYQITEVGTIKALQEVELIAKAAGTVGQLSVKLGDSVDAGDAIAVIDYDEANNPAKVNYYNAQLQLANAKQTLSETFANNQDTITRALLRVESLEVALGRSQRNLTELRTTTKSTENTLVLQLENVENSADTAEVSYKNVVDQFEQAWKDLLKSSKNSLDSAFTHLESEFIAVEDIINPNNAFHFSVSNLSNVIGARDSHQLLATVNAYNDYRRLLENSQTDYDDYLPLTENTLNEALSVAIEAAEDLRELTSKIRLVLSNSVSSAYIPQATIDAYVTQATAAESIMLGDVAMLNALEKTVQTFKLDRTSQIATADNNRSIANNQLTDAGNALLTFQTTGPGSVRDLEVQIEQTGNDLLSAQADFDSAKRNATVLNSAKTLEINTLSNQLRLAQQSLDNNIISSPIDGVLSELTVDEGDYVAPGTYLGKVIQHEQVKLVFYVSEAVADRLSPVQAFTFPVQNGETHDLLGVIDKISPSADPVSKKIRIEGDFINTGLQLKPEMLVNITLDISAGTFDPTKVYVPMNSIIFAQNDRYVYVVESGQAVRRDIEIGGVYGVWIEVLQGLSKSDELIVEGHRNLPPAGDIAVTVVQ